MTSTSDFFDMAAAPMRIGAVRLRVRDQDKVASFYQSVLGLSVLGTDGRHSSLGAGTMPLIELVGDPALPADDGRQAGLFHTAFLMPTRAELARWLTHTAANRVPLQGASDHLVSEAIYLVDPEGNGIEVYADRPLARWRGKSGEIRMSSDPLDVEDLLRDAGGTAWAGFPAGGSIGHVHLQVGDTATADGFYRDVLGLEITARYPGASFYGSGGYHHQLAGNVWNSRGAGRRPAGMAGLDAVEAVLRDPADLNAIAGRAESAGVESTTTTGGLTLHDPWGTAITLKS